MSHSAGLLFEHFANQVIGDKAMTANQATSRPHWLLPKPVEAEISVSLLLSPALSCCSRRKRRTSPGRWAGSCSLDAINESVMVGVIIAQQLDVCPTRQPRKCYPLPV